MDMEAFSAQLQKLVAAEGELAQLKQTHESALAELKTLRRQLKDAEKSLAALRRKEARLLTPKQEEWLFKSQATLDYSTTRNGKYLVKLKTGRRADGRPTEILIDGDKKPTRSTYQAIETHKKARGQ